jgi:hypothetical protein
LKKARRSIDINIPTYVFILKNGGELEGVITARNKEDNTVTISNRGIDIIIADDLIADTRRRNWH